MQCSVRFFGRRGLDGRRPIRCVGSAGRTGRNFQMHEQNPMIEERNVQEREKTDDLDSEQRTQNDDSH